MQSNSVTYICFVRDHSGSMAPKARQAKDNFNEQLAKLLKEDDETMDNIVTVIEFDDQIHCNIEGTPIANIKPLESWWTGGTTALYDAIAHGINKTSKLMDNDKRQDKAAIIVVQTDGGENDSSDYAGEDGRIAINKRINELEQTGKWSFTFLGENIDKSIAEQMGFKNGNIMSVVVKDSSDAAEAYSMNTSGLGEYLKARKMGMTQTYSFYAGDVPQEEPENTNKT